MKTTKRDHPVKPFWLPEQGFYRCETCGERVHAGPYGASFRHNPRNERNVR